MIGRLRGTLAEKQPPHLIIDVNGVGYELEVPMTTLYRLPKVGESVTVHTHLVVREDAHLLYGFAEKRERELFRELIRLNGVGPKLALALMSGLEVDELVRCVQAQDTSALVRVPGVGKKTAERLLVELKDRFKLGKPRPPCSPWCRMGRCRSPASPLPRPMRSAHWSRWATSRRKPARQSPRSRTRPA